MESTSFSSFNIPGIILMWAPWNVVGWRPGITIHYICDVMLHVMMYAHNTSFYVQYNVSSSELSSRTLWLSVWDWDRFGRNQFLGEIRFSLSTLDLTDSSDHWYSLQDKVQCHVIIVLFFLMLTILQLVC